MPAVRVFQILKDRVTSSGATLPMEKRAMFWFQNYRTDLDRWQKNEEILKPSYKKIERWKFSKQLVPTIRPTIGKLFMFMYQAKWDAELPYWDALPLCIPLEHYDDGFLGLNLHYLPYRERAILFDNLYSIALHKNADFKTKFQVTYEYLTQASRLRAYKPCVKRYLYNYIRSGGMLHIGSSEWDIALFLPCELFQKQTKQHVWVESKKKIGR